MLIENSTPTAILRASGAAGAAERSRLLFLDGIRGLAALAVLLLHVMMEFNDRFTTDAGGGWHFLPDGLSDRTNRWLSIFGYGHFAVPIFIVLSGFCLMLPVARDPDYRMRSFGRYILRRAKRILPPYYAALILSLIMIASFPILRTVQHQRWDSALPAFAPGVLTSHVLLVHNWNPDWSSRIDPPMWSVAPEWQIYFLFPLVLLPLVRRIGLVGCIAITLVVTSGSHFLWGGRWDYLSPWFVGLFAVGMGAAVLSRSMRPEHRWLHRIPWGLVATLGWCGFILALCFKGGWMGSRTYASDVMVGLATAALLVTCSKAPARSLGLRRVVVGFLEWTPVVWLGTMSYSLYLFHYPLLPLIHSALRRYALSPGEELLGMFAGGIVIIVPICYLFHRAFERPFMNFHQTEKSTAISAAVNPAI